MLTLTTDKWDICWSPEFGYSELSRCLGGRCGYARPSGEHTTLLYYESPLWRDFDTEGEGPGGGDMTAWGWMPRLCEGAGQGGGSSDFINWLVVLASFCSTTFVHFLLARLKIPKLAFWHHYSGVYMQYGADLTPSMDPMRDWPLVERNV